ncbi:hypothetical protein AB0G15_36845 [Streptosporangium sp. NPDC023825]|uniref:hypothetical protein n=1 Tax=Streptosporangium sp. NPDC023825 TaxID=3154909 RepID=UPI003443BE30
MRPGSDRDTLAVLAVEMGKVAEQVSMLAARVDDLGPAVATAAELAEQVTGRSDVVEQLTALRTAAGPVPTWAVVTVRGQERHARLNELHGWVMEILVAEYSDYLPEGQMPDCWTQHRAIIHELAWLYNEWHNAYLPEDRRPRDAADWHDRWLPGVLRRMEAIVKECPHRTDEEDY